MSGNSVACEAGRRRGIAGLATVASATLLLAACAMSPSPLTDAELKTQAAANARAIAEAPPPVTAPLTLEEALARALKYNLDHKARAMEEALAVGQLDVSRWDLLPQLTAQAGYAGRSEHNATFSRTLGNQNDGTTGYTYSDSRDAVTAELGLTWNVLDFGVSYYGAKAQADRVLSATERRRKVQHNLVQQVRGAWWQAAASQILSDRVATAIREAEQALADARKAEGAGVGDPVEALQFQRQLLESIRQLETVAQELSQAKIDLSTLIGLPPGTDYQIAAPSEADLTAPSWDMPMERMEELALVNNPDLRESLYQERISRAETRQAIIRLIPGVEFTAARKYDANYFLDANRWNEIGAKVTWNLLNVFSAPDRIQAAEAGETLAHGRTLAMHMAVLSQAHVARNQFEMAVTQFDRASQLHEIDKKILGHSRNRTANRVGSTFEKVSNETTMIVGLLRRYQTLAQAHSALGRIYATLGIDEVPAEVAGHDLPTLTLAMVRHNTRLLSGAVVEETTAAAAAPVATEAEPASDVQPTQKPQDAAARDDVFSEFVTWLLPDRARAATPNEAPSPEK